MIFMCYTESWQIETHWGELSVLQQITKFSTLAKAVYFLKN